MKKKCVLIALVFFLCFGITGCKNEETKKKDYPDNIFIEDELIAKTVKINFDSKGGSKVKTISVKTNQVITQPEEPIKEGYIFLGWYNKDEIFDFSITPKDDILLEAKWEEINEETFTVTFNSNGGSTITKQVLTASQQIKKPSNPTRNGYTFLYWELDNKEFDFNSEINSNVVLTAKWKSIWDDDFNQYRTNSFFMPRCYTIKTETSNKSSVAEKVNIGDKVVCYAGFENYNGDDVKSLTYTLTYGSGLKLVNNNNSTNIIQNGDTYYITYDKAVNIDDGIGSFVFEVVKSTDLTFGIKDIKFITSDNRKYYTDMDINSLTYAWNVSNETFTRYRTDSFGMAHCYTEESVLANKYQVVKNVNIGDRIVCDSYFETYSSEKVKTFKYTLTYGSGLKLVKADYGNAIKDGNTFLYTLNKATSVGDYGSFTFEVVGTENLTYGLSDIKFITDDSRYFYTGNETNTLNYVWNSKDISFSKHSGHSFSLIHCYNNAALLNGKFESVTSVKVGDRISCMLGLEIDSSLKVKSFKFSVTHGSGLSLVVDNLSDALRENNTYIYTLKSPTSFFEEYTKFTFDVVSTENLTYGLSDIKFITSNNGYYYTDNITYSLK